MGRGLGPVAVQAIPGIRPILGAVLVAEIGDIHRFSTPEKLTCWAGMTPLHRESTTSHRGRITKMGCGGRDGGLRRCLTASRSPGGRPDFTPARAGLNAGQHVVEG